MELDIDNFKIVQQLMHANIACYVQAAALTNKNNKNNNNN